MPNQRTPERFFRIFLALVTAVILAACDTSNSGSAADEPHTYAGETISLIIGLDASAGGTQVGRLLAKHLEENLEGNPTVIVNNLPGASGLSAQLQVLLKAPNNGTTIYYGPRSSLGELLQFPGYTFKYTDFTPLGGVQISGLVIYARTDAVEGGASRSEELVTEEPLLFGGMPPEHGRMIISTMALDLLDAPYRYIAGYPSSGNIRAAVISGEVNTGTDAAHAYLTQVVPVMVDEGDAIAFFSLPMLNNDGELVQNPLVPGVLSVPDLYESLKGVAPSGVEWDAIQTMIELDQTMQHVFLGPPDMDAAATENFRAGLEQAMAAASFAEEAEQQLSYVPGFVPYTRQTEILGATSNVSPEVLEYIKAIIAKNSGY
jgi:tripartite-type tricarboxylate transporter receptor subunit TctC